MACRPISGRAPAPSPRVRRLPIWTLTSALLLSSAWASVFTAMNSTPRTPSSIMRFSALPPPPPTPTTFIRAFCDTVSSSSKIIAPSGRRSEEVLQPSLQRSQPLFDGPAADERRRKVRSEEHTSELQSQFHLVCRLLLEKKKKNNKDKHNKTVQQMIL